MKITRRYSLDGVIITPPITGDPRRLHFIGDSTTADYQGAAGLETLIFTHDDISLGYSATSQAVAGHAVNQQRDIWLSLPNKNTIDAVHISLGINNMVTNLNINNFKNEFQSFINEIKADIKIDGKIILSLMIPAYQGLVNLGMSGDYFLQFNNAIRNEEFTNIAEIITTHYETIADNNNTLKPEYQKVPNDNVHPNTEAKIIWMSKLRPILSILIPIVPSVPPGTNTMKFEINFTGDPSSINLTIPKYKFNKISHIALEWDDGAMRIGNPVVDYLTGLTYTDGCNNNLPYKAAIALNCGFGISTDFGYNPSYIQPAEIREFINKNWDISNHGMVHGPDPSAYEDTVRLDNLMKLRVNYFMSTTVIPTNYTGYTQAAFDLGYVMSTSQGDITGDAWTSTRVYRVMPAMNTKPVFIFVIRDFTDMWSQSSEIAFYKAQIDDIVSGGRDFERIGTHNPLTNSTDLNGFKSLCDYIKATTNDQTIVCSTREFLEYRQMALQPVSKVIQGNKMIVTIDISSLSIRNRWRDLSFIASNGAAISSVVPLEGVSSVSFNPATRLINIFSQKKVW